MTDKDETMRSVLKFNFSTAKLILCKFHVFQIFNINFLHQVNWVLSQLKKPERKSIYSKFLMLNTHNSHIN